jgi:hypothetical protein
VEVSLDRYWTAFGRLAAVFSGALVVLLGLLADVPLLTACGRGFAAYVAVRVLTRIGAWAIAWSGSIAPPAPTAEQAQEVTGG